MTVQFRVSFSVSPRQPRSTSPSYRGRRQSFLAAPSSFLRSRKLRKFRRLTASLTYTETGSNGLRAWHAVRVLSAPPRSRRLSMPKHEDGGQSVSPDLAVGSMIGGARRSDNSSSTRAASIGLVVFMRRLHRSRDRRSAHEQRPARRRRRAAQARPQRVGSRPDRA